MGLVVAVVAILAALAAGILWGIQYGKGLRLTDSQRTAKLREKSYARWYAQQVAQIEATEARLTDEQRERFRAVNLLPEQRRRLGIER